MRCKQLFVLSEILRGSEYLQHTFASKQNIALVQFLLSYI